MMKFKQLLLFFMLLESTLLYAQTNTWNGSTDDDWHKSCNWSLNSIPTCSHDVVVPNTTNKPQIDGVAHCKTIAVDHQAGAKVYLNSNVGGKLEIALCPSTATNNGGCTVPGSSWSGNNSNTAYFTFNCVSPINPQTICRTFSNNTGYAITLTMPSISCVNWSPATPVIPANGSLSVCINVNSGCCVPNAFNKIGSWSASDGASGTFKVETNNNL